MTDSIGDMLTGIRNAKMVKKEFTDVRFSKINVAILDALKRNGFIKDYNIRYKPNAPSTIRVYLKYDENGEPVINEIKRISKPGCRIYKKVKDLKPYLRGIGIYILSTPKGILSNIECKKKNVGGEVICSVW